MKKSLFALAAVGAFAGAAQAQSSVTVYGLLDVGYVGNSQTVAGPTSVSKRQQSAIGTGGQSTPRLGFRGTEDLGGGMSAFFTLEAAIQQDASGLFNSTANGSGNRQAFVGLGKKGVGTASIGTQYTPIHEAVAATDAGGTNNVIGDVIYDRSGTGATAYSASGMSTNDSYTVRSSNALILKSERISGFGFKGMLVSSGTDTTQSGVSSGGKANNSGWGIGADFVYGKLLVTANYQSFKNVTSATPTTFQPGYNGGNIQVGTNAQDNQQYYAATYDFGILKAFAQYINRKVTNTNNSDNYVSRTAQQIGVSVPVTSVLSAFASGGTGRINNTGTNGPTANFNGWQVGTQYNLSKRTNLYAIYGQSATSNAATGSYAGTSAGTANTSWNQSGYAVGVRHTF